MTELISSEMRDSLFAGDGEMCKLMRSHDWSQTPLGPVEQWPQSLRTTVSILLNSRYPMFTFWGPQLVKLYNDAYRPVLGSTKHPAALGRSAPEIWPEIWDEIGPLVNQVVTKGEPTWSDNFQLFMHRSGYLEETYFTFSYSPIRDETGGIGGLFCACTETTQQVLGDRRLRTLRDLAAQAGKAKKVEAACEIAVKTLANNAADIPFALLYLLDAEGKQAELVGTTGLEPNTPASPSLIDLTEFTELPWPLAEVVHTAHVKQVTNVIERFGELQVGLWEESPHTALVLPVASPGQERPTALLVAGISSRRALDDDYQGFLELVAGQVASTIADARAYQTERQRAEALAEIDRAKTVFFSNVSHEFRTPLTLMLAPLEDALADTTNLLPPTQRDRLEIIQRNGLRLLKLVNTLLDFSRIEAGRMQAVYQPTDLASFTAELASNFRSLIERAGMSLVVECPPLSEPIYVDREMWEKIVLNLLSNAFKFTLSGTISICLQSFGDRIELVVKDTGIGIPTEEIPYLFERFHRVKNAQVRSFEGSGIGLSLVLELVKLHGGNIHVTSELGQGSCFTVTIPTGFAHLPSDRIGASRTLTSTAMGAMPYVEEALRWLPEEGNREQGTGNSDKSDLSPITCHPSGSPVPLPLREDVLRLRDGNRQDGGWSHLSPLSARILVVDDNADMREYVKRLLQQRYQVEVAEDGIAALTTIQQWHPDLVLTDVMMPRLDGFGLLRELRTDPQTQQLPIILLSARAGEEARIEGLETGADDYLTKPFSTRELLARVEATLKMAQIRKEAAVREQELRLATEKAQQEAEAIAARLSHILESMSDAFMALDQDWRIVYQNAAAEQINHGKPRTQVLGKTHWEEWPASANSELEYQYRYAMAQQIPVHFEYHYYAPPNFDVWVEIHAYPSKQGLGIFYRDISDRKRAEAELKRYHEQLEIRVAERTSELSKINAHLQESESTLRSFFNSGLMMMGIVELHNNDILHISDNQASAEFFGTTPEAMQNKFASDLGVSQQRIDQWISYYRQAQQIQAPVKFEYLAETATSRKCLSVSVCPIAVSSSGYSRFSYVIEDISNRKQAQEQIEASLREKEVLLKEIHHRVKNNLSIVSSLLQMQHRRIQDQQAIAILRDSQNRIASIALVHEKLYRSQDLANIDFSQYILDLTTHLFDSYNVSSSQIKLNLQIQDVRLDIESAVPYGLIINELVSNALKYAFPAQIPGEILVKLSQDEQHLILIIRDNGVGLPQDFDHQTKKTLGITLVQGLVKQLRGTIEINSQQGTEFKITLVNSSQKADSRPR